MKSWYGYELDKLVKELKFVPYKLRKGARHEAGKTYWCGYWHRAYTVLSVNGRKVKIVWLDTGEEVEHMTSLEIQRDYELIPFEALVGVSNIPDFIREFVVPNNGISYTGAELKALCCAGVIDAVTVSEIEYKYFRDTKYAPNDNVYYFLDIIRVNCIGERRILLNRDLGKSPRKVDKNAKN